MARAASNGVNLSLAACLLTAVLIQCIGAWQDSQTTDEAVHLSAGVIYWRTGDWFLNPEHPPLVKLLAAVPLLPLSWLNLPTAFDPSVEPNQWVIGATMLYRSAADLDAARWLMFMGRLPMIALWALLATVIWTWSKRLWGSLGALISTGLYLFDPNFLGHGHLVTTDVAAALAFTATLFLFWRLVEEPRRHSASSSWPRGQHWWWFAIVFGLAQVTKFSLLVLWAIIPILSMVWLLRRQSFLSGRQHLKILGLAVLGSMAITWLVYGFEIHRPSDDPRITRLWDERQQVINGDMPDAPAFIQRLVRLSEPSTTTGKILTGVSDTPIPAYGYWRGVFALVSHNYYGHAAFLWGEFSYEGWWWYFPVTILFKTPALTLILLVTAGGIMVWRRWKTKHWPRPSVILVVPVVIYLAWSMTGHINIGVRHILPLYPLLYIGLGGIIVVLRERWKIPVAVAILIISAAVAIRAYPNTIGYFNFLAGGTNGGHRYLLDSNLDWNQDIWRLRNWLNQKHIGDYHLVLFGSIPSNVIFPEAKPVLTDQDIEAGEIPHGWIIISAGQLFNIPGPFHWLQTETPYTRIGSSIFVYRFNPPN